MVEFPWFILIVFGGVGVFCFWTFWMLNSTAEAMPPTQKRKVVDLRGQGTCGECGTRIHSGCRYPGRPDRLCYSCVERLCREHNEANHERAIFLQQLKEALR